MWATERLQRLADFCLLRAGRLDAALAIQLKLRQLEPTVENRYALYLENATRCTAAHVPGTAVQSIESARRLLDEKDPRQLALQLRICDTWAGAQNWALAAGQAGTIARDYATVPEGGEALVRRMRYLAAQEDAQSILHEIDDILKDPRCQKDLPELLCRKWRALRKQGKGQAASLLLKQFVEQFPQDPNGAEMYFTVATDCLATQRYDEARAVLESLRSRYPKSSFDAKAQDLLEKLGNLPKGEMASASRPADRE